MDNTTNKNAAPCKGTASTPRLNYTLTEIIRIIQALPVDAALVALLLLLALQFGGASW